uniref:Uncharacterized protein n=1 Tax=Aureoumbra lagunensis TaxID=44058 RepID=A0A7S3K6U4_9STRA
MKVEKLHTRALGMDKATLSKAVKAAEIVVVENCVIKNAKLDKIAAETYDEVVTQLLADPLSMPNGEMERAKSRMLEIIGEKKRTESVLAQRKLGVILAHAYGRRIFVLQLARLLEIISEWKAKMNALSKRSDPTSGLKSLSQEIKHEVVLKSKWLDSLRKKTALYEDADFGLKEIDRLRAEAMVTAAAVDLRSVQDEANALGNCLHKKGAQLDNILSLAAQNGHNALLALTIRLGASPNTKTQPLGATPLTWAIQRNDKEAVIALLNAGANPNLPGYRGYLPHLYAQLYAPDCLTLLIEKGCDARHPERQFQSAIHRNEPPTGYPQ